MVQFHVLLINFVIFSHFTFPELTFYVTDLHEIRFTHGQL